MLQIAVIGLGSFGVRMLEELNEIEADVIILDKDQEIINTYKDYASAGYVTDVINQSVLEKCVPATVDAAIVDVGNNLEAAILTTNSLHKIGVKQIITKAHSNEQGEILELVGATKVVYPDLDAAQRLTPVLASNVLFDYMQISSKFALAKVNTIDEIEGKTLANSNMRKKFNLNVVAIKKKGESEYSFLNSPDFVFTSEYVLLVAGSDEAIKHYTSYKNSGETSQKVTNLLNLFKRK